MNKEQLEFLKRNKKIDELCEETQGYGRMQLIDRIATSEIDKDNLIKFLEDKINELQVQIHENGDTVSIMDKGLVLGFIASHQDILERVKSGKYE